MRGEALSTSFLNALHLSCTLTAQIVWSYSVIVREERIRCEEELRLCAQDYCCHRFETSFNPNPSSVNPQKYFSLLNVQVRTGRECEHRTELKQRNRSVFLKQKSIIDLLTLSSSCCVRFGVFLGDEITRRRIRDSSHAALSGTYVAQISSWNTVIPRSPTREVVCCFPPSLLWLGNLKTIRRKKRG